MAKAQVVGAFGARGTGKTGWLMQQLKREHALAVWDYKHDPRMVGFGREVHDFPALVAAIRAPRFQVRYMVNRAGDVQKQFSWFCRAVFLRGCMAMFVDELPAVTRSNKAAEAWRECVNIGREYRTTDSSTIKWLSIYATAQRPSECDKSFISNLDVVHTGRLSFFNDAMVMAKSIGCSVEDIMALQDLHYLEKSAATPGHTRGLLKFSNAKKPARGSP